MTVEPLGTALPALARRRRWWWPVGRPYKYDHGLPTTPPPPEEYNNAIASRLIELLNYANHQIADLADRERFYSRIGRWLGLGGAIGAGTGGIGAIVRSLPDWVQITFGFIAFVGAFLSAASGTIRAPEKADAARVRRIQLEAYARRYAHFC
jgi:hypothetical protein